MNQDMTAVDEGGALQTANQQAPLDWSFYSMMVGDRPTILDRSGLSVFVSRSWYWRGKYLHATKKPQVALHRVILGAAGNALVDHANCDTSDNRLSNLRIVNRLGNAQNRTKPISGRTSRFKGVHWKPSKGFWTAVITAAKRSHFLGYFDVEEDAARAYDAAALKLHGIYARINF